MSAGRTNDSPRTKLKRNLIRFAIFYWLAIVFGVAAYGHLFKDRDSCEVWLYSIDNVVCRGQLDDPDPMPIGCQCASAAQSLFGHLGVPLALGLIFAALDTKKD
jgi:hypothetical protein